MDTTTDGKPKAKKKQKIYTVKAERRPDGTRVERTYDEEGKLFGEYETNVNIEQLGADDTGVVLLNVQGAREDFDRANAAFKKAGGKFDGRRWRVPARVGLRLVRELHDDGFRVEKAARLDQDERIRSAVASKFLGPLNYRHPQMVVTLTPTGFEVETTDGERFPCSVGEALLLDESGTRFTADALACIASIRGGAGFPNSGRGVSNGTTITPEALETAIAKGDADPQ